MACHFFPTRKTADFLSLKKQNWQKAETSSSTEKQVSCLTVGGYPGEVLAAL